MAGKQKASINPTYKSLNDNEVRLSVEDFENNPNVLLDIILRHKKQSTCKNCKLTFSIVGFKYLTKVRKFDKPCIFKIYMDLLFVQPIVTDLVEKYGFIQKVNFNKPEIIDGEGVLMLYCDEEAPIPKSSKL